MTASLIYQRIKAPNDVNGNPRRLYVVYDLDAAGDFSAVYDEGYSGRPRHLGGLVELPSVSVTASEYNVWVREAKQAGKLIRQP